MGWKKKKQREYIDRIIDGDTLKTKSGKILRLINVNAPELGEYGSIAASNRLQKLVPKNTYVIVEFYGKDKYGRDLAKISNWRANINRLMQRFIKKLRK